MSAIPELMTALVQLHDGLSDEAADISLESLAPFVELTRVPVPRPKDGQALVKVALASVNPSDVAFIKGVYGEPRSKGKPAGFEGVGTVVEARGGIMARRLTGRRVAFFAGARGSGSWAQYAVADLSACIPLRKGVGDVEGSGIIVNPLTAVAMFDIVRRADSKAFVMTAGASQLCKLIASLARDGGFRAISVVRREEQISRLKDAGAAQVLSSEAPDFEHQLADLIDREKPTILLDAVTGPTAWQVFRLMPPRSRWIVYGRMERRPTVIEEPEQLVFMRKSIEGFWLTDFTRNASIWKKLKAVRTVQKRFESGKWHIDVTAKIPIAEAMDRLAGESKKPDGKVFIVP